MERHKGRGRFIALCIMPAFILFLIFMVYPTLNVFRMAFFKWGGMSPNKEFVGLNNFRILIKDARFIKAFQNQLIIIVFVTIFTLVLAIGLAAILTREKLKGQNFFRVVFYIPNILSVVIISAIFSAIYDVEHGLLNGLINLLTGKTGDPTLWLGQKNAIYSIIIALIWQAVGYYMVMYMSSMSAIPESLYESADLEGAGKINQFFKITLPLIWTNLRTTLTFFIISTINMSFLIVNTMTGGGPDGSTEVFLSYMYKEAYGNSNYGYGMAIGAVVFIFSFLLSAIVNQITKRETVEL